jgi:hypothetical protein
MVGQRPASDHPVMIRSGMGSGMADLRRGEGGFVLPFVVFMLFAVSVAGVTGYLMVSTESTMAKGSSDGSEALTVARAGLERFVAEQVGTLPDTVSYAIGGGVAVVTTSKLLERDSITHVYRIRSEATVTDIFSPNTPARRTVTGYATYHLRPLPHHAAVMIGTNVIDVDNGGRIDGRNANLPIDCSGGNATNITGAIAAVGVFADSPPDVRGLPDVEIWSGGSSQILDSIGLRWDVLSDPDFPVDFENVMPDFGTLPSDSFPLVRYTGWMSSGVTGRGVLIVDGVFDPWSSFSWDGIVIAKHVDDVLQGEIHGLLIGGIEEPNMYNTVDFQATATYYPCNVYAANESLAYLELMPSTIHEVF